MSKMLWLFAGCACATGSAVVWAEGQVHAEWWVTDTGTGCSRGTVDTVTVLGDQLRVLSAAPTDTSDHLGRDSGWVARFDRQLPLIGPAGQATAADCGLRWWEPAGPVLRCCCSWPTSGSATC